MMARRSSALDRATAAINRRGAFPERKSTGDSEISDDAAELTRFLSGLSQQSKGGKTSNAAPAGLSDISISSDDDFMTRGKASMGGPVSSTTSKFMKSSKATIATPSKHLPLKSISSNQSDINQSPAMLRLAEQTQRLLNKSKSSAVSRVAASPLYKSEDSTGMSEASESIGGGGNKFLKNKQQKADGETKRYRKSPAPAYSLRTSTEDDSDMAAYIQKLSLSASEVSDHEQIKAVVSRPQTVTSQPEAMTSQLKVFQSTDYESSFATETFSAESSAPAVVSSPEEINTESEGRGPAVVMDIAELRVEPVHKTRKDDSTKTKTPLKKGHRADADIKKATFSSLGLMSVDDLLATQDSSVYTASQSDATKSIRTESSIKSQRAERTISHSDSSIHTYKESVQTISVNSEIHTHTSTETDAYDSDFDDTLRETESIATDENSGSYRAQRSGSQSRAKNGSSAYSYSSEGSSRVSRGRSMSYASSEGSRFRSYSRSRTASKSDSRSRSYSWSKSTARSLTRSDSRSKSYSGSRRSTRSHTRSNSRSRSHDRSRLDEQASEKSSISGNYSSSFEDAVDSVQEVREKMPKTDASVQTGVDLDEMILKYYWMTDQAAPPVSANQQAKESSSDTPRIAKMAVSNEALEVLTTYNPALLALNDMMKGQLELSRQFLNMQKDMQKSIMDSIEREHVYTTLEDTNKFIESHRRPRLTFEQAVCMVRDEMNMSS
ncbi:serine-rich adhesin for platelets-like isoform X2 [Watersipora subatra]|uniref:serine-rich adhesin for platelets-like isoform X2 n=1 Tax=Watersipora subatra TaxID=2589382 RepID=UPI00355B4ABC